MNTCRGYCFGSSYTEGEKHYGIYSLAGRQNYRAKPCYCIPFPCQNVLHCQNLFAEYYQDFHGGFCSRECHIIGKVVSKENTNNEDCIVCMNTPTHFVKCPSCCHYFCFDCIATLYTVPTFSNPTIHAKCPLCRRTGNNNKERLKNQWVESVRIQALWRGYNVRKYPLGSTPIKFQALWRGYNVRKYPLGSTPIKFQALWRGYSTRLVPRPFLGVFAWSDEQETIHDWDEVPYQPSYNRTSVRYTSRKCYIRMKCGIEYNPGDCLAKGFKHRVVKTVLNDNGHGFKTLCHPWEPCTTCETPPPGGLIHVSPWGLQKLCNRCYYTFVQERECNYCDMCELNLKCGDVSYQCVHECDFDICENCFNMEGLGKEDLFGYIIQLYI